MVDSVVVKFSKWLLWLFDFQLPIPRCHFEGGKKMVKALLFLLQFAFIFILSEAKSSSLQPQAAKSFNISYLQVACFIPMIFFFFFRLFYLGFLHLFELKFYFLRFCSFLVLKESGKLFLHGCYNNKLLLNEIHARPDQYCFWWCLRQSGSFYYEFPDLFGEIFYVFLFYALLPKISTYCEN